MLTKRFFGKALLWCMLLCVCLFGCAVAEGSDTTPALSLTCGESMDLVYYIGDWYHSPGEININVKNYDELYALYNCDPEWSFEYSGNSAFLGHYTLGSHAWNTLDFLYQPEEVGEGQVLMTCTWGDLTATCTFNVSVLPGEEAPTSMNLPDSVTVKAGETFTLGGDDLFQPDNYVLPEHMDAYFSIMNFDYNYFSYVSNDEMQSVIEAHTPGVYFMDIYGIVSNVRLEKTIPVIVTDENGDYPLPLPRLSPDDIEHYQFANGHMDHGYLIYIGNYSDLSLLYEGEPTWQLTVLSGNPDLLELDLDVSEYTSTCSLDIDGNSPYVGEITARVDCIWGDVVSSIDVVVHCYDFTPCAPTDLDVPSEITVKSGETFALPRKPATLPEQIEIPEGIYPYAELYTSIYTGDQYYYFDSTDTDNIYMAVTPGIYHATYTYDINNYEVDKTITIKITDENGDIPPILSWNDIEHTIFVGGNSGHSWPIELENYSNLKDWISGDPVWTLTSLSGESDVCYLETTATPARVWLECPGDADLVGDATYRLDCTWGDVATSINVTVHVIDFSPSAPTGLDIPSEVTVQMGETFTLPVNPATLPNQVEIPDGMYTYSYLDSHDNNPYYEDSEGNEYHTYVAVTPGIYETNFYYTLGNHRFEQPITIKIADENGVVPEPEIQLSASNIPDVLYLNGNCYPTLAYIYFDNYSNLPDYGDVNWELTVSGASEDILWHYGGNSYYDIYLNEQPETTGDITIKVSCSYGELYKEYEFTVPVVDLGDNYPTSLNLPESIDVAYGVETILQERDLLPEAFADLENYYINYSWNENVSINSYDGETTITGYVPGTYPIEVTMEHGNIRLEDTFLIKVADEDGNVPPLSFDLRSYDYVEEVELFINGNYLPTLDTFYIRNYELLSQYISSTPEWSIEVVNGDFRPFEIDSYTYDSSYANLVMVEQPTMAGEFTLRVLCTWGDYTAVREIALTIHDADVTVPTELNIPDELIGKISEEISLNLADVLPSFDATAGEFGFRCYGTSYGFSNNEETLDLYIRSSGIFAGEIIWRCGNVELSKDVMLKIADSEGNLPELTLDLMAYETEVTFDLNGDFYQSIGYFDINNSTLLESLYGGKPVWSLEVTSGSANLISLYPGKTYAEMRANQSYASVGDTTVRVNVTWGNLSASSEFTLHIVESEVKPSLVLPDEIVVKPGDVFSFDAYQMMPDGWKDLGEPPYLSVYSNDDDAYDIITDTETNQEFMAVTPGYYTLEIYWSWLNHDVSDTILLKVTEADGTLPALDLDVYYNNYLDTDTLYVGGDYYVEVGSYRIQNADLIESMYGGAPRWSIDAGEYSDMFELYGSNYRYLDMNYTPSKACDITYTVTCTWGDLTWSDTRTLHFLDAGDLTPTGLDVPGSIRIKAGESATLPLPKDIPLLPAGALYPAGDPWTYINSSNGLYTSQSNDAVTISADEPGTYTLEYIWSLYNFRLTGLVIVEVEDENGNVPGPDPELYVYEMETQYVGGNNLYITGYDFFNSELFYNMYGGEPTVTATCSDPSIELIVEPYKWASPDYPWGDIILTEPFSTAGEYEITVTCTWGESVTSASIAFTVEESPCGIPTGLNLPDEITMTVDELIAFDYADIIEPAGWYIEDAWYSLWCNSEFDALSEHESNAYTAWFLADVPGIHNVTFELSIGNFMLSKTVLVTIADENGEVPMPELIVYDEHNGARDIFLSGNSSVMHSFYIPYDTYETLKSLYGGEPTWSIANVEGELNLSFEAYDNNRSVDVMLANEITALGTTTGEITCTWGDQEVTVPFTINVVPDPEVLPEYLELPDSLTLKVGETFTFGRDMIRPETVDITPSEVYFGIGGDDALWASLTTVYRDDYTETITFSTPGVYTGYFHWNYINFSISKRVTITVTDENGEVPTYNMTIEGRFGDENGQRDIFLSGNNSTMHGFSIPYSDFETMKALYGGEPTWTISNVEGELDLTLDIYNENRFVNLIKQNDITSTGMTTGELTCTWGDQVVTQPFCINVVPDPEVIPEGVNMPDSFTIKVGETFTYGYANFLPENLDTSISDISFGTGGDEELWESLSYVGGTDEEDTFVFSKPGVYTVDFHYNYANFFIGKNVTVTVADENGELPVPELIVESRFNNGNDQRDIFLSGNNATVHGFRISHETFDTLKALYGSEPTWTLSNVEGAIDLTCETYNDGQYVNLIKQNDITSTGITTGELTCTWGGQVVTTAFAINVVPDPEVIPEGINMPDAFTIKAGETFTYGYANFLPENLDTSISEIGFGIGGDEALWESLSYVDGNTEEDTYVFSTPGVYQMHCHFDYCNFFIGKAVTVTVTDENGETVLPELELYAEYGDERTLYANGNRDHIQSLYIDWETYEKLSAMMPDKAPVWSVTVLEGDMDLFLDAYDDWANVICTNVQDSIGTTVARVDCEWGDISASRTFTFNVVEGLAVAPEDVDFPSRLDLTVGDTFSVPVTGAAILPVGSIPADASEVPYVGIAAKDSVWNCLQFVSRDDETITYRVTTPGVLPIDVYFNFANFQGSHVCLLYVADENGEVPEPDIELDFWSMTEDLTRTIYTGGNSWSLYTFDMDWTLAEQLEQMYGEWPTWSYEVLEGSYPISMYADGTWVEFNIDSQLTMPDRVVVRVTLSCGDLSTSKDFTLNIVELPCDPPTGIDFPDMLDLQVGEEFTVRTSDVLPTGWMLEGETPWISVDGNSEAAWQNLIFVDNTGDAVTYKFNQPGSYPVCVYWSAANISVSKNALIRVADENGEFPLPDLLIDGYTEETFYQGSSNIAMSYGLMNINSLAPLFEGNPVWSYELLQETDVKFSINVNSYDGDTQWFDVSIDPDSPTGTLSMKITVTWDTVSASAIATCNVVENPNGVPTGLAPIQTNYQITLGESITLPKPTFLPEGWTSPSGAEAYIDCNCWEHPESVIVFDQGDSFLVEFLNPGVYNLTLNRYEGGFNGYHSVYVVVTDENGEVEAPELECFADLTTSHAVAGKGLWTNISVWGGTGNYTTTELSILKDGEVVKTYTDLTLPAWGKLLDVDLAAGSYEFKLFVVDSMGNTAEFYQGFDVIDAAPLVIANAALIAEADSGLPQCVVEYTGGSDVANTTLHVYNQLNSATPVRTITYASDATTFYDLPDGTYRVLVSIYADGETVEAYTNWFTIGTQCDVHFAPDYYLMAPGSSYQLQLAGDMSNVASITWSVSNASLGSVSDNGVYTGKASGNAMVYAHLTLTNGAVVTIGAHVDCAPIDTLTLPAALTTIEEEAFYGVSTSRIVIPAGVTSIGSKAFAECEGLLLLEIPATVESFAEDFLDGSDAVRIVCTEGSKAHIFAEANGIEYYLAK